MWKTIFSKFPGMTRTWNLLHVLFYRLPSYVKSFVCGIWGRSRMRNSHPIPSSYIWCALLFDFLLARTYTTIIALTTCKYTIIIASSLKNIGISTLNFWTKIGWQEQGARRAKGRKGKQNKKKSGSTNTLYSGPVFWFLRVFHDHENFLRYLSSSLHIWHPLASSRCTCSFLYLFLLLICCAKSKLIIFEIYLLVN